MAEQLFENGDESLQIQLQNRYHPCSRPKPAFDLTSPFSSDYEAESPLKALSDDCRRAVVWELFLGKVVFQYAQVEA